MSDRHTVMDFHHTVMTLGCSACLLACLLLPSTSDLPIECAPDLTSLDLTVVAIEFSWS